MIRVSGAILAGGLSRRMGGGDKGLADLAGKSILARVIKRFAPQVSTLALNANGDPARFSAFGLPVISDEDGGYPGPLAGILAAMRWSARGEPTTGWVATAPADSPFLPGDLVARLMVAVRTRPGVIAVAASGGRTHHVVGLWPVSLADHLARSLGQGERAVVAWASRHDTIAVEFPSLSLGGRVVDPFFNINTPEDLAEAHALLACASAGRP